MYSWEDGSPRGGVTARITTTDGYRLMTVRETDPANALKRAQGFVKKGQSLARIHDRGNASIVLWTPEGGWVADAKARLIEANQRH